MHCGRNKCGRPRYDIRDLKHEERQHDDDGHNKLLQINDSKENLSFIIIRMNFIQYKNLKTFKLPSYMIKLSIISIISEGGLDVTDLYIHQFQENAPTENAV